MSRNYKDAGQKGIRGMYLLGAERLNYIAGIEYLFFAVVGKFCDLTGDVVSAENRIAQLGLEGEIGRAHV